MRVRRLNSKIMMCWVCPSTKTASLTLTWGSHENLVYIEKEGTLSGSQWSSLIRLESPRGISAVHLTVKRKDRNLTAMQVRSYECLYT